MNRWGTLAAVAAGILLVVVPSLQGRTPRFLWNVSPSVPLGFYRIQPGTLRRGDLVITRLPSEIAELANRRGYLPKSAHLIKFVLAIAGDRVCRFGDRIFVRGVLVARALPHDSLGRLMPSWHGCQRLVSGNLFLLAEGPKSFDSRYFGVVSASDVVGRAVLLWPPRSRS